MQALFNSLKGGMFTGLSEPVYHEAPADVMKVTCNILGFITLEGAGSFGDFFLF